MRYLTGHHFYDCGCPHHSPYDYDKHGRACQKLLLLVHKLLHKEYFDDYEEDDYFYNDDEDWLF